MSRYSEPTFLWHDYETWGVNPAMNGPAQFAAIRTDSDLNEIGEPIMLYCKPPRDALPQPQACLITGITPQHAEHHGLPEAEFMAQIYQAMMQPQTCSVGYNSIRFDDEVTRYALYRNFYDAYEREWKNGNSRWDLIDVVRLCAALRPEGIQWPMDEQGKPTYRLEALTAANSIEHAGAHDALVDVRATIALARLIKQKQPKLFEYALSMRNKRTAASAIDLDSGKPVFHVSGKFGNANYCASVVLPLCKHPTNQNAVVCFDLRYAPDELLALDTQAIRERLFSSREQRGDQLPMPLKNIHLNKCPMVAPVSMLDETVAQRIGLNLADMRQHFDQLSAAVDEPLLEKIRAVFQQEFADTDQQDVDAMLYSGGFFSDLDRVTMQQVRSSSPEALAGREFHFEDARLPQMLFRYRARNWPQSLIEAEQQQWQQYCFERLTQPPHPALISAGHYQQELEQLFMQYEDDEKYSAILGYLMDWLDTLIG